MRLIDADKLLNKCYHAYPSIDHYCTSRSVVDAKDIINAPTVDAVPVVHGRWDESKEHIYLPNGCKEWINFYCSECEAPNNSPTDYCPNCGAKMDEVSE